LLVFARLRLAAQNLLEMNVTSDEDPALAFARESGLRRGKLRT
jgi:hypothetical protein